MEVYFGEILYQRCVQFCADGEDTTGLSTLKNLDQIQCFKYGHCNYREDDQLASMMEGLRQVLPHFLPGNLDSGSSAFPDTALSLVMKW